MLKKRMLALFLLGALLATVLCACGDKKQTDNPSSDETSSSGEPVNGGEVVIGISQDLGDSLDPYQMTAAGTREVLFNVYEGLVKPNKDGEFIPAVAAELPKKSEDGTSYTFTLRENVKFHNGAVVTADDVVKSFKTCAATTVDTALAAALSDVKEIKAVDAKTVSLTLKKPNGDMLSYIASVAITPANYTEQVTKPVGTGSFKFVSRSVQDNVVLEKFADYWGQPAYLDKLTYKIYEDPTALMSALGAGSVDMAVHLTTDQVSTLSNQEYKTVEGTMNLVQALYLNHKVAPFDNGKVRKALSYAIDVDEILAITADGHGTKVGTSIYPAFTRYFDQSLVGTYPYDPEKAKALLAEAGYPDGFSMTISVPSNYTPHVKTAEVMVEQLAKVGVKVKLDQVEWETWLSNVYNDRNFQSTVIGFDAVTLTPGALLNRWVSTNGKNMINYNNPQYDAMIAKAEATVDDTQRTELYKQAAKMLTDTAANVYVQDLADFVVMKKSLDGYAFYPLYVMDMSTVHYVK
ncbi:MAG: transporter substrate-binding protein [Evtepia sp.]|jgi:peptide/nickel transport system substrate-binding protein|nr:transporter substrate-binding protein [Evtepia sp.]